MLDMWWDGQPNERYWVEIRWIEGIGTSLSSPNVDERGPNGWYDLVASVREGDIIYHYNARESRFVGRSVAAEDAWEDTTLGEYGALLRDFTPIAAPIDLAFIRAHADEIYGNRDRLLEEYGRPLYLPFQYYEDRSTFRMMSNYFAKMPSELVSLFFGADGLAGSVLPQLPPLPGETGEGNSESVETEEASAPSTFLEPFKAKADSNYLVSLIGGVHQRKRPHERLVNTCAGWLKTQGLETGRNAVVDLGVQDPRVIIEAKTVKTWPTAVREAVGQLYEYRYFKVIDPKAGLIFLADQPVPDEWVTYLERDRKIGAMWPEDNNEFHLSRLASKLLHL